MTLLFFYSLHSFGQHIEKHKWKQRVLLILTDDKSNNFYKKQLTELNKDTKGIKERKLIIYHITPSAYTVGLTNIQWENSTKLYKNYKKTKASFEIILIGLDSGVKLRQTKLVTNGDLYNFIDAMPMRRNEQKEK